MRAFLVCLTLALSCAARADAYDELYRAAGWAQQRVHFHHALDSARQQYRDNLPPAVFEALVANSERRFEAAAMDRRALQRLRERLADPAPALAFYRSPLGRRLVEAELRASSPSALAAGAGEAPPAPGSNRQLLIRHLAQALPASQAGAEVTLALAGVAADSLSQMLPGLLAGGGTQRLVEAQRQRLVQDLEPGLDDALLRVYRDLSDAELEEYLTFARSAEGQAYYAAMLEALRAALAVGRDTVELGATGLGNPGDR